MTKLFAVVDKQGVAEARSFRPSEKEALDAFLAIRGMSPNQAEKEGYVVEEFDAKPKKG